ncbi:hypothetical protein JG688_00014064 [Phytophthora aleatoria]|uniref:DDE-1 domain-containing protein n=1 Tax=Phytophthora aleatoria TaxID=2496075 RepID=A0A8J5IGG9_9STRA|nr:hypothetical protein JG688_00014064 [Phytophthora aleatoria]
MAKRGEKTVWVRCSGTPKERVATMLLGDNDGNKYPPFHRIDPILLLWDDFSGHWTQNVLDYAASINVVLEKAPPRATSVSQPADAAWSFPLKASLRNLWHTEMQTQITRPRATGTKFKRKAPDRIKICGWISMTWDSLMAQLEKLSLLEGPPVDESSDFDSSEAIVEEATV